MRTKTLKTIAILVLVLGMSSLGFANDSEPIDVKATIDPQNPEFDIAISRVIPADCTGDNDTDWATDSEINFGTLDPDETHKIFRSEDGKYYAVDVGVLDNTPATWTITHTVTSLTNGTDDLDDNVNVVFVREKYVGPGESEKDIEFDKESYRDSNNNTYSETQFPEGTWLRIYYGVSNGVAPGDPLGTGCVCDAPGVSPITYAKSHGSYSGSVTLTVAP